MKHVAKKIEGFFKELLVMTVSSPMGFIFGLFAFNIIGLVLLNIVGAIASLF